MIKNKYLAFGLFVALFLVLWHLLDFLFNTFITGKGFSCSACGISHGGLHTVSQEEKVITMKQYKTGGHTIFRDDGEKTADLKVCDNKYPLPMRRRMKFGK